MQMVVQNKGRKITKISRKYYLIDNKLQIMSLTLLDSQTDK